MDRIEGKSRARFMEEENQEIYGSHNKKLKSTIVYLTCQSLKQGFVFDDPMRMVNFGHSCYVDKYNTVTQQK